MSVLAEDWQAETTVGSGTRRAPRRARRGHGGTGGGPGRRDRSAGDTATRHEPLRAPSVALRGSVVVRKRLLARPPTPGAPAGERRAPPRTSMLPPWRRGDSKGASHATSNDGGRRSPPRTPSWLSVATWWFESGFSPGLRRQEHQPESDAPRQGPPCSLRGAAVIRKRLLAPPAPTEERRSPPRTPPCSPRGPRWLRGGSKEASRLTSDATNHSPGGPISSAGSGAPLRDSRNATTWAIWVSSRSIGSISSSACPNAGISSLLT